MGINYEDLHSMAYVTYHVLYVYNENGLMRGHGLFISPQHCERIGSNQRPQ